MQTLPRCDRATQAYSSLPRQRHSGYEPSDTENDLHENPWHEFHPKSLKLEPEFRLPLRYASPRKGSRRFLSSRLEQSAGGSLINRRGHDSKSPYKPVRDLAGDDIIAADAPKPRVFEIGRANKKANYASKRSATAPRPRPRQPAERKARTPSPPAAKTTASKINERVGRARLENFVFERASSVSRTAERKARTPSPPVKTPALKNRDAPLGPTISEISERAGLTRLDSTVFNSTGSVSPGDIFFSREWTVLAVPKPSSASSGTMTTIFSSSGSRRNGSGRFSEASEAMSAKTTESMRRFTENRRRSQKETWFGCVKKGSCSSSRSPERAKRSSLMNEAFFIEKASVVENIRLFWGDKHRPCFLNGFTCQRKQAQLLKQLVSNCPHILLKGPSGSGKRSLARAFLREIYGDANSNISYDLRHFQVKENKSIRVAVPVASSPFHFELNVHSDKNAKYAFMGLVREITKDSAIVPETSNADLPANYKVLVLYGADKTSDENIQHLIKWSLDCHNDACKIILCCEDDAEIIDTVTSRCKVVKLDTPVTHEIMEILIQISRKENFDLPTGFAAKIAIKSKHNLRKAIMALEACKAHNYPFLDDQPIPIGWEEISAELASEILANPSPNTLFVIRGRLQKLLGDFVHPKLILQKLVEEFLKGIDASIKRELYYWQAYYDKRVPTGPSALLKIEEFVAKFMSIYRKSTSN